MSRLRKLDEGDYSALILAEAGLKRMETRNEAFIGRMTEVLDPSECLYAVGQVIEFSNLNIIQRYASLPEFGLNQHSTRKGVLTQKKPKKNQSLHQNR